MGVNTASMWRFGHCGSIFQAPGPAAREEASHRGFESSRILYFDRTDLAESMSAKRVGPILAQQEINYRRPISYPDRVRVETTVTRVGTTSFVIAFKITSANTGELAADGEGVLVMFDYQKGEKVTLNDTVRQAVFELEASRF